MRNVDRISGCVLGAAIGDAMGHATEFLSMEEIRQVFGPQGVQGYELFWQQDGKRFAPYTDDTQMAEVVLRTLIATKAQGLALDASMQLMAQGFVEWAENPQGGHRSPGNACLAGCRALKAGVPWNEAGGAQAGGCGSVMRAYPFGLVFVDDVDEAERWAVAHSSLTHRDPIALAACAAMARGVALNLRGISVDEIVTDMVAASARYSSETASMIERAAQDARGQVSPEVTLDRLRGWAAHEAIAAAAFIFVRHANDVQAAILEGANTPGDSDSIATLAGALVGARVGVQGLPSEWILKLERSDDLRRLALDVP